MKNNMSKIVIFLIFILITLLIAGGVYFFIVKGNGKKILSDKVIVNKSENLKRKHCLNGMCIEKMIVSYQKDLGVISFVIENKTDTVIPEGFFKIVFDDDKKMSYIAYNLPIEANQSQNFKIEFLDKKPVNADDYKIEQLTPEELAEAQQSRQ